MAQQTHPPGAPLEGDRDGPPAFLRVQGAGPAEELDLALAYLEEGHLPGGDLGAVIVGFVLEVEGYLGLTLLREGEAGGEVKRGPPGFPQKGIRFLGPEGG
jgi:hypothetical protein